MFVLAEYCSEMSYLRLACEATIKQVLPQSPGVLSGDICIIQTKQERLGRQEEIKFGLLCLERKKN